ncbi:DnaB-like helicase C-terminal domain-containing protein [Treponema sp.]|uniref:DnaB-like helicase C-terminal domain-containing protein n=1 Tax=Treponema sp. TaxID=166 RepID=UPI00298E9F29|nr:DnaB-like helicase C-terminal domain-containing protein [Treponema sp.]MCQ2240891.1 hypothetical protein [Treponema sp.]
MIEIIRFRKLKKLAKELNIAIIVSTPLSRSVDDSEISLNQLRGTGEVEILSDVVFLLPKPDGKIQKFIIAKNNRGNTGEGSIFG